MTELTATQMETYRDRGYVFPVRVMSEARAAGLRRRFEAFERSDIAATYDGREHELYRFKAHLLFPWVDEIVHNEASLDVIEQIIGPDILAWTVGVFVKEPWSDYAVPWHQDSVFTGVDRPERLVRGWHSLTVARPENGTMRFVPRSCHLGDLPHISHSSTDGMKLRDSHADYPIDEGQTEHVTLEPGEAAFFNCRTLHCSGPNRSDDRRINVVVAYMSPEMRPASGKESAMLVRGVDRYRHWRQEPRPKAELDAAALAAHKAARDARLEVFFKD